MSSFKNYSLIIGLFVLALIIVALLSPMDVILARQATFIGTDLHRASDNETPVRTKMDIGDVEHMEAFPKKFGSWIGLNYDSSEDAERLEAEFLLLRTYLNMEFYQPVNFMVIQSKDTSTFHPPPVCYRSAGWEIEEEGMVEIPISHMAWANEMAVDSNGELANPIRAKKLLAAKRSNGIIEERELALYFYVKGGMFENKVTMFEVTLAAPLDGPYDDKLSVAKYFMGDTIPYMFEPAEEEERLATYLTQSKSGILLMTILFLIPIGIIIVPRVKWR